MRFPSFFAENMKGLCVAVRRKEKRGQSDLPVWRTTRWRDIWPAPVAQVLAALWKAEKMAPNTSAGDSTKGRLDEGSVVHPRAWAPKIGMNGGYLGVQAARIVRSVLVVPHFFFSETAMGAHWPESVKSLLLLCHGTCGLGYRW